MRDPLLTSGMERVLRLMRDEDEELVVEGRECWVGLHRTNGQVVQSLLGLCLIRDESSSPRDRLRVYVLNEDGRKILDDSAYMPLALRERETRLGAIMWIRTQSVVRAIQNLPPLPKRKRR